MCFANSRHLSIWFEGRRDNKAEQMESSAKPNCLAQNQLKWGPESTAKECWTLSLASEMFLRLSFGMFKGGE